MGFVGQPNHPEVQAVIADAVARILKAGKAPGILSTTEEQARKWLAAGALFVAVGVDTIVLAAAARQLLAKYKAAPGAASPNGY
jgi:4-hydroxy-2-oxoheptanedioate aldolase